jgi:hypothetical protein
MPTPTEPVSGASIASAWGSSIHNYVYNPAGFIGSGDAVTMLTAEAYRDLPLDATSDPGTWYDSGNDRAIVPSDGAGLYVIVATCISDGGATTGTTGVVLRRNGSEIGRAQADNEGSNDVGLTITALEALEEGDIISLRARNLGTGTLPTVYIRRLTIIKLGNEIGIAV